MLSSQYKTALIIVGLFLLIDVIIPLLLNIINIDIQYAIVYLVWTNILLLLYIFLPKSTGNVFMIE